ncbi:MAG: 16S rRNA (cytosine(1402)-N(4))-methyltransferase RsmH [Nitrospinales bacterium]
MLSLHKPVLAKEVVRYLNARDKFWIVDGTLGDGGHSELILKNSGPQCRIVGIDQDPHAIARARKRLSAFAGRVTFVHGNFGDIERILMRENIEKIDGLILDLGVSSLQLESPERGFSFSRSGPLDMRMDPGGAVTAESLLTTLPDKELQQIFKAYGEERFSKRIVRAIRKAQGEGLVKTTSQLSHIISAAIPLPHSARISPATRTFQALRIAVNDELGRLKQVLKASVDVLNKAGRVLVISFHSLEDRIVKHFFQEQEKGCVCPPKLPVCVCGRKSTLKVLTRKPITPSAMERTENPRAASGKLRAAERVYV